MLEYTSIQSCRMHYLVNYLGDDNKTIVAFVIMTKKVGLIFRQITPYWINYRSLGKPSFRCWMLESPKAKLLMALPPLIMVFLTVGAALRHSKYEAGGDFPEWLLKLTLKAYRKTLRTR